MVTRNTQPTRPLGERPSTRLSVKMTGRRCRSRCTTSPRPLRSDAQLHGCLACLAGFLGQGRHAPTHLGEVGATLSVPVASQMGYSWPCSWSTALRAPVIMPKPPADGECSFCSTEMATLNPFRMFQAHSDAHHRNGRDGGLFSLMKTEAGLPDNYFL